MVFGRKQRQQTKASLKSDHRRRTVSQTQTIPPNTNCATKHKLTMFTQPWSKPRFEMFSLLLCARFGNKVTFRLTGERVTHGVAGDMWRVTHDA
jgi:hypothetical protein